MTNQKWVDGFVSNHIPRLSSTVEFVRSDDHMTKQCLPFDSSTQVPNLSCRLCGKEGHANTTCTYQYYVPKGEQVGRGATLICTCCKKEGCHPGMNDWVGIAVPNYCGKLYEHRTEDCPRKQGIVMVGDQAAFVGV